MGAWVEITLAIIALISSVSTALINRRYRKVKKQEKRNKLINHPVHSRMKSYKRRFLIDFQLNNKGKEAVLRDLFVKKFELWTDALYDLAKEIDEYIKIYSENDDKNYETIKEKNLLCFNETLEKFNAYHYGPEYTPEEKILIEIVIGKFNIWQSHRSRFIEEQIMDICNNSMMYPTCERKQIAIFDIYMAVFAMTLNDAMKTVESINGQLEGKYFRGIKISKE